MIREGTLQRVPREVGMLPKLYPAVAEGHQEQHRACVGHSCSLVLALDFCMLPAHKQGTASAVLSPFAS